MFGERYFNITDKNSVAIRELQDVKRFVFTDNLMFEGVFYKGVSNSFAVQTISQFATVTYEIRLDSACGSYNGNTNERGNNL